MKKIMQDLFFVFCFFVMILMAVSVKAENEEIYLIEKPDGTVAIHYYVPGSQKTLAQTLKDSGLDGLPITRITISDFPADRTDRKYWKKSLTGKKIGIDETKKTQDLADKSTKKSEKCAVLKLTSSDCDKAEQFGIIR